MPEQYLANAMESINAAYRDLQGALGETLTPDEEQAIENAKGNLRRALGTVNSVLQEMLQEA